MRGGRSLLILLVLAVGLGSYIYFVESKRDTSAPEEKREKVFSVSAEKIDEVEVHAASGEVTTLKRNGTEWTIAVPAGIDADGNTAASLAQSLESLERQKVLDENPASVKAYGLEPARFSVTFKVAGDATAHRLDVGSKTPTGGDLYARADGQPRLFLISAFNEESLNRTTFDLRDKTILKFERDGIDGLTLESSDGPALALSRKGENWRMTKPLDARADFSTVDSVVGRVFQAQMKAIESPDGTKDLKKYGLDKPQVVATLAAGSTRAQLAIGGKKDDGTLYARDLSRPIIFAVDKTLLDDLKKKADDLRIRDIFEFRSFTALSLDITEGGTAYAFAKEKGPAPAAPAGGTPPAAPAAPVEAWKQQKPADKAVNETAMTDLLNTLSTLRADKFTDKAFASGQDLVVVAKFGDAAAAKEERVILRKSGDTVHAIREGEAGAAVIPTAEFDKAIAQIKELVK